MSGPEALLDKYGIDRVLISMHPQDLKFQEYFERRYGIENRVRDLEIVVAVAETPIFKRGDSNGDGRVDIADPITNIIPLTAQRLVSTSRRVNSDISTATASKPPIISRRGPKRG